MSVQRPYGQWDSTVEADSYTQTSVQLSQVRVDETDTYWVCLLYTSTKTIF